MRNYALFLTGCFLVGQSSCNAGEASWQSSPGQRASALGGTECTGGSARLEDPATGHCYIYFASRRNWLEADQGCSDLGPGTHLAAVDTVAESQFLTSGWLADDGVWLGAATDADGPFVWVTGELVTLNPFPWDSGEPDRTGTRCLAGEFRNATHEQGYWHDEQCDANLHYLCERELEATAPDAGVPGVPDAGTPERDSGPGPVPINPGDDPTPGNTSLYDCAIASPAGSGRDPGGELLLFAALVVLARGRRQPTSRSNDRRSRR